MIGIAELILSRFVFVSAENGLKGRLGKPAYLEEWLTTGAPLVAGETAYKVTFDWDGEIGLPGAFVIRNEHHSQFYLRSVTLDSVPGHGRVHFVCNSWVYPADKYKKDRVFFANKVTRQNPFDQLTQVTRELELTALFWDLFCRPTFRVKLRLHW